MRLPHESRLLIIKSFAVEPAPGSVNPVLYREFMRWRGFPPEMTEIPPRRPGFRYADDGMTWERFVRMRCQRDEGQDPVSAFRAVRGARAVGLDASEVPEATGGEGRTGRGRAVLFGERSEGSRRGSPDGPPGGSSSGVGAGHGTTVQVEVGSVDAEIVVSATPGSARSPTTDDNFFDRFLAGTLTGKTGDDVSVCSAPEDSSSEEQRAGGQQQPKDAQEQQVPGQDEETSSPTTVTISNSGTTVRVQLRPRGPQRP